jgi:hypothetical protein
MKLDRQDPPREFDVGRHGGRLRHVADGWLAPDEMLTLRTDSGTEVDVTRKSWGYYATPSLNGRLSEHGLRAALAVGVPRDGEEASRMYLLLVERGREQDFEAYIALEEMRVVAWLDSDEAVDRAAAALDDRN